MHNDEFAAAQPPPRLWFIARHPLTSFVREEDQSSDWILMRVGAGL